MDKGLLGLAGVNVKLSKSAAIFTAFIKIHSQDANGCPPLRGESLNIHIGS